MPHFLELCATTALRPIPENKGAGSKATPSGRVTNGPYRLVSHERTGTIQLSKNPQYWDASNVKINYVEVRPLPNSEAVVELFDSGELDWTGTVPLAGAQPDLARRTNIMRTRITVCTPSGKREAYLAKGHENSANLVLSC